MKEIIGEVKNELSGNIEKIIILYATKCKFCKKYLENFKTMIITGTKKQKVMYKTYNVDNIKGKIIGMILKINKLPATVFINDKNKVRAIVFGVLNRGLIQKTVNERLCDNNE